MVSLIPSRNRRENRKTFGIYNEQVARYTAGFEISLECKVGEGKIYCHEDRSVLSRFPTL